MQRNFLVSFLKRFMQYYKLFQYAFNCSAEHYHYTNHSCPHAYKKNTQVPVCPLCNKPIPVNKGQLPDIVVGAHIGKSFTKIMYRMQVYVFVFFLQIMIASLIRQRKERKFFQASAL